MMPIERGDELHWSITEKGRTLDWHIKQATKKFQKRWHKKPEYIVFNSSEVVEYNGDLKVLFRNNIAKRTFALGVEG